MIFVIKENNAEYRYDLPLHFAKFPYMILNTHTVHESDMTQTNAKKQLIDI